MSQTIKVDEKAPETTQQVPLPNPTTSNLLENNNRQSLDNLYGRRAYYHPKLKLSSSVESLRSRKYNRAYRATSKGVEGESAKPSKQERIDQLSKSMQDFKPEAGFVPSDLQFQRTFKQSLLRGPPLPVPPLDNFNRQFRDYGRYRNFYPRSMPFGYGSGRYGRGGFSRGFAGYGPFGGYRQGWCPFYL